MPSGAPSTLTLPAVGQKKSAPIGTAIESSSNSTLQYNKGYVTVRWSATDPNNDPLMYKVELRGKRGTLWRILKDELQDRYYAFDSASFPDGEYVVRVTASDAPGNTVYVSTVDGGVFKCTNFLTHDPAGPNWTEMNNGITDHFGMALAIDPTNSQRPPCRHGSRKPS